MLPNTKERALPAHTTQSLEDYLVYLKHVALYRFAARFCADRFILDLGCGEGYGCAALASVARLVVAADRDLDAVAHAQQKYAQPNLAFVVCDAQHLPFQSASFDTAVSFEVIEHIPNVRAFLHALKRVARARVLLSTPNRAMRLLPLQKPWNRFHLREYAARDLARALEPIFPHVRLYGITAQPAILEIEKRRVKQNPLTAYPKMLAQILLPSAVYDGLKRIRHTPAPASQAASPFDAAQFSADQFCVTDDPLRECINLVALGEWE